MFLLCNNETQRRHFVLCVVCLEMSVIVCCSCSRDRFDVLLPDYICMTTMASPKPQSSSSAESPEKLSEVQVLDSVEPLVTASFSVPLCSAQVMDSSELLVPTSPAGPSGMAGLSGIAGPSGMADLVMPVSTSSEDLHEPATPSGSSGRRVHYYSEELRLVG